MMNQLTSSFDTATPYIWFVAALSALAYCFTNSYRFEAGLGTSTLEYLGLYTIIVTCIVFIFTPREATLIAITSSTVGVVFSTIEDYISG